MSNTVGVLYQGDLLPALAFTAVDQSGNAITLPASCFVLFGPVLPTPGAGWQGTGTCTVVGSVATYQLTAADTASIGNFQVQLVGYYPGNEPRTFAAQLVQIAPRAATFVP